jgi:hypothetical protein
MRNQSFQGSLANTAGSFPSSGAVSRSRVAASTTPPYQFTRNVPSPVFLTPRYRMKNTPTPKITL